MTRHKTKRKSQRGGAWYNPMTWFGSSETIEPTSSIVEKAKEKVNALNESIGNAAETTVNAVTDTGNMLVAKVSEPFSSTPDTKMSQTYLPQSSPQNSYVSQGSYGSTGGKRRRRSRTMKGGKGNLGLTYYATPVAEMNVAKPTTLQFYANGIDQYSIKGGSKKHRSRKRKSKKNRRNSRRHKKR